MHLSQKFAHPKNKSRVTESLNFEQLIEAVNQASREDQSWLRKELPPVKRKRIPEKKPIAFPKQEVDWPSVELSSDKALRKNPPQYQFYYESDTQSERAPPQHIHHVPINTGAWANGKRRY